MSIFVRRANVNWARQKTAEMTSHNFNKSQKKFRSQNLFLGGLGRLGWFGRLGSGGGSSLSGSESLLELSLGSGNFGSVFNWGRADWKDSGGGTWGNWDVGSGNPESVDGVGDVVDALDETVGVDVAVRTAGDAVGGVDLLLGRVAVDVAVVEGAELILAVVLDGGGRSDDWDRGRGGNSEGSGDLNGGGNSQGRDLRGSDSQGSGLGGSNEVVSGDGLDEGRLNSLEDGLGNEGVAGYDPDGGRGGQDGRALGDCDGLNWCQGNSVAGLNGRAADGFQNDTENDLKSRVRVNASRTLVNDKDE